MFFYSPVIVSLIQEAQHRYNTSSRLLHNPVLPIVPITPFVTFPSPVQDIIKDPILHFISRVLSISLSLKWSLRLSAGSTIIYNAPLFGFCRCFPEMDVVAYVQPEHYRYTASKHLSTGTGTQAQLW